MISGVRRVGAAGRQRRHGLHRRAGGVTQRGVSEGLRRHRQHQDAGGGHLQADRLLCRHPRRRRPGLCRRGKQAAGRQRSPPHRSIDIVMHATNEAGFVIPFPYLDRARACSWEGRHGRFLWVGETRRRRACPWRTATCRRPPSTSNSS